MSKNFIKPGDDNYDRIHANWVDAGRPRQFSLGTKTYRARTSAEGTMFRDMGNNWEQYYGSTSTGKS